jgi:D-glycero-D-manno-heptose 1,7-bisphosphate phosphatase
VDALHAAGFLLIVVTNQPDVGRGRQRREVVETMHARPRSLLPLDDVRVCYHSDSHDCLCRKPRPGMLHEAASLWSLDPSRSVIVGDRWRDVSAGRAAGCPTILLGGGYGEEFPDAPDAKVESLLDASELMLGRRQVDPEPW